MAETTGRTDIPLVVGEPDEPDRVRDRRRRHWFAAILAVAAVAVLAITLRDGRKPLNDRALKFPAADLTTANNTSPGCEQLSGSPAIRRLPAAFDRFTSHPDEAQAILHNAADDLRIAAPDLGDAAEAARTAARSLDDVATGDHLDPGTAYVASAALDNLSEHLETGCVVSR
jgi:hypothetical protein